MESKLGRKLHAQAAKLREEGNYAESLDANDRALLAYDADNDALGFSEGIACRSITLRNYANEHNSRRVLILAEYEMLASVALAKESGIKEAIALPLYQLAQLQEDLGKFSDAVQTYKEAAGAMGLHPPASHNRPSVFADMKVHMMTCEYKAGDKTALFRAEQALEDLEQSDEKKFEKDVWLSGAHMHIAEILKTDAPDAAKDHLEKARVIIDANPDLILRKQQLTKLESSI